jgi:hypothetical protein
VGDDSWRAALLADAIPTLVGRRRVLDLVSVEA